MQVSYVTKHTPQVGIARFARALTELEHGYIVPGPHPQDSGMGEHPCTPFIERHKRSVRTEALDRSSTSTGH